MLELLAIWRMIGIPDLLHHQNEHSSSYKYTTRRLKLKKSKLTPLSFSAPHM